MSGNMDDAKAGPPDWICKEKAKMNEKDLKSNREFVERCKASGRGREVTVPQPEQPAEPQGDARKQRLADEFEHWRISTERPSAGIEGWEACAKSAFYRGVYIGNKEHEIEEGAQRASAQHNIVQELAALVNRLEELKTQAQDYLRTSAHTIINKDHWPALCSACRASAQGQPEALKWARNYLRPEGPHDVATSTEEAAKLLAVEYVRIQQAAEQRATQAAAKAMHLALHGVELEECCYNSCRSHFARILALSAPAQEAPWDEQYCEELQRKLHKPAAPQPDKLSQGTFECDICGRDTPHHHYDEEVEIERFVRPVFEKTGIPRHRLGRIGSLPYSDGGTERLWQYFIIGWFESKRLLQGYWNYKALPCAKCGDIHDGNCLPQPDRLAAPATERCPCCNGRKVVDNDKGKNRPCPYCVTHEYDLHGFAEWFPNRGFWSTEEELCRRAWEAALTYSYKQTYMSSSGNKMRQLIEAVTRDAVQIAITRNDLTWDKDAELTEEEIAQDAADAVFGDGTCADEPIKSVKELLATAPSPLAAFKALAEWVIEVDEANEECLICEGPDHMHRRHCDWPKGLAMARAAIAEAEKGAGR